MFRVLRRSIAGGMVSSRGTLRSAATNSFMVKTMLAGPRLLTFYCRITLGSERCVERTLAYFRRFGAAEIDDEVRMALGYL